MTSSKLQRITGAAAIVGLLLPLAALAQADNAPAAGGRQAGRGICAVLENANRERLRQRVETREATLHARRLERDKRLSERRVARDEKLAGLRQDVDDRHLEIIARLEGLAKDDAQKAAVTAFKSAVDTAIGVRRTAFDAAVAAFRQGLDASIAARKDALDAAAKAFRNALETADGQAVSDCSADGADSAQIRSQLQAAVKAARDQMKSDVQAAEKVGTNASSLVETRKQAIDAAKTDFRAAMEKARDDLKAAFASPGTAAPADSSSSGAGN